MVNWYTVRLFITLAKIAGWKSKQIYSVLDLSKAPIDADSYLHSPEGFYIGGLNEDQEYIL